MLALEGELLRDLRSSGRGLDGGSVCIEMQQSNLREASRVLVQRFFLSILVTIGAFFKKMPVSSQPMMDWQGVFFKGACFPSSAGGF